MPAPADPAEEKVPPPITRLRHQLVGWLQRERGILRSYTHLLGGSVTRLTLSLVYFIALTSALSLGDFGLFVTSASVGMILGRPVAFGYGANIFVVAATRPRLLGRYLGVFCAWLIASLPVCVGLALLMHWAFFPGALIPYLVVVMTEVVVWRLIDLISTINGGLGRYGRSAAAFNIGFLLRTIAAVLFLWSGDRGLTVWSISYAAANTAALVLATVILMPHVRIRLDRRRLLLRGKNALTLGGAGMVSVAQGEVDKVLVLALGGEVAAGLFGACIRLIDLTAMPVRAFNVLMVRALLRNPSAMGGARARILVELGVAAISTLAFAAITMVLLLWPNLLGRGAAQAVPMLPMLWAVPALRNLIEYQAELLYAWQRNVGLLWISALLIVLKSAAMATVFWLFQDPLLWAGALNAVFLSAYIASTVCTYAIEWPRARLARAR